jgi:hypothetical protein
VRTPCARILRATSWASSSYRYRLEPARFKPARFKPARSIITTFELKATDAHCDGEGDRSLRLVYKTHYPDGAGADYGRFASNIPWGISLTKIDTMDKKKKETICNLIQFILKKAGLLPTNEPGWYLYTEARGG